MRLVDIDALNWDRCPFNPFSIRRWLEKAPTVEAVTVADVEAILEKVVNRADKHGYWIERRTWGEFVCSECKTNGSPQWKRCPICEAKMDGGKAK